MPGLLQSMHHHNRGHVADVQAISRCVVTDIGRDHALGSLFIQGFRICALMDVATIMHNIEEF